jgi:hypothetical protein
MKKVIIAVMAVMVAVILSSCSTKITRPGLQVETNDRDVARAAANASTPYTAVDQALADSIRGNAGGTAGMQFGATTLQDGFIYNNSNFLKKIVISLYALPDGTTASLLMANTMTGPPPDYKTVTRFLEPHTWQKISLRPGRWTVREYNENQGTLIKTGELYVYIIPGEVTVPPSLKQKRPDRNTLQERQPTPQEGQTTPATFAFCYPQG